MVAVGFKVGLSVNAVLGPFFVYGDDACFPFGIGARDAESDVCDGAGVVAGNFLPHCFY